MRHLTHRTEARYRSRDNTPSRNDGVDLVRREDPAGGTRSKDPIGVAEPTGALGRVRLLYRPLRAVRVPFKLDGLVMRRSGLPDARDRSFFDSRGHEQTSQTHIVDWDVIARSMVRDRLEVERDERVIPAAPIPVAAAAMSDALRCEYQAGARHRTATILNWTPHLATLRAADGCEPEIPKMRAPAIRGDALYLRLRRRLLSRYRGTGAGRTPPTRSSPSREWVLAQWDGRGLHFHSFHDPPNPRSERCAGRQSGSTSSIRRRSSNSIMPRWRATCAPSPTPSSIRRFA